MEGDSGRGELVVSAVSEKIKSKFVQADEKLVCYWSSGVGERELYSLRLVSRVAKKRSSDKVEIFKTGGGTPNLLCTWLDERLAAMGALIEPLSCRFDCDYEYETAVSSGTQGDESIVTQVDENMFTLDDHPLDVTVTVKQGEGISKKARKTLCSTPLTKATKIGKSKRKPNASVKTAEAANARKLAMEKDYQQIAQFKEEHRATMTYKRKEHILKMKVLKAKLEHYNMLNKKKMKLDLEKEN
ncbi:hypothetical protein TNCV_2500661 [Trichonephila clavipes]|nr:hypothetical protein TNCV_2500661 [Trichonephila clavipes]